MPGVGLSYAITSRELVKQVPIQQRVPCPLLFFGAHPNPPIKKGANMNDNRKLINIRVTEKEKAQLDQLAQKCGLSLSEYLRKRGLGYEPGPYLDDRFYAVYTKLCEISNLPLKPEAEAVLTAIFNDLRQNLFLPRKQTQREIMEEVAMWQQRDSGL